MRATQRKRDKPLKSVIAVLCSVAVLVGVGCTKAEAVEASPEMKQFLAGFGSSSKVSAALKAHTAPGVATQDMEMYNLTAPTVTATEVKGAQTCYTFDAKSGATTRSYGVCWEGGKIRSVEDKGMH